ncbi:hypothetical protein WBP07_21200 (plasmid) [Novosphingobium sp. BL-8A]
MFALPPLNLLALTSGADAQLPLSGCLPFRLRTQRFEGNFDNPLPGNPASRALGMMSTGPALPCRPYQLRFAQDVSLNAGKRIRRYEGPPRRLYFRPHPHRDHADPLWV